MLPIEAKLPSMQKLPPEKVSFAAQKLKDRVGGGKSFSLLENKAT